MAKTEKQKPTTDNLKFKIIIQVSEKSFSWGFDEKVGVEQINIIEAIGALHYTANEILKKGKSFNDTAPKE
jgi:hypothetical protein